MEHEKWTILEAHFMVLKFLFLKTRVLPVEVDLWVIMGLAASRMLRLLGWVAPYAEGRLSKGGDWAKHDWPKVPRTEGERFSEAGPPV